METVWTYRRPKDGEYAAPAAGGSVSKATICRAAALNFVSRPLLRGLSQCDRLIVAGTAMAVGDAQRTCTGPRRPIEQEADESLGRRIEFPLRFDAEQADLLRPYVARYFEVLPEIWSASGGHLRVARGAALFPVTATSAELVGQIDAFLARGECEPGLARVLIERRDQVVRALRSRALAAAAG